MYTSLHASLALFGVMITFAHLFSVSFLLLHATSVHATPLLSFWDALVQQDTVKLHQDEDGNVPNSNGTEPDLNYAKKYLRFASFGDSWSSGVNYGPPDESLEYNYPNQSEVCRCRRVNEAWPVQLMRSVNNITNDTSFPAWTSDRALDLDYVACYASYFEDIPGQIANLNQSFAPEFATLTLGGNPGGFPDLLYNCIFWPDHGKDYGPEYPDPEGECWKAIERAKETVQSQLFLEGILRSVSLILTEPRIRQSLDFKLYVIGYAELFNPDDDSCDDLSFGVWSGKKPLLKKELRREINGIISMGRQLYDRILNSPLFSDTVRYVDINPLFKEHRFCEKTDNGTLEQQNDKSWLYNLQWPACIPITDNDAPEAQLNATQGVHDVTWPNFCRKCGSLLEYGEFVRPFHPKPVAHKVIAQHVADTLSETLRKASTQPYADIIGFHGDM